jgi:hypothetical protein
MVSSGLTQITEFMLTCTGVLQDIDTLFTKGTPSRYCIGGLIVGLVPAHRWGQLRAIATLATRGSTVNIAYVATQLCTLETDSIHDQNVPAMGAGGVFFTIEEIKVADRCRGTVPHKEACLLLVALLPLRLLVEGLKWQVEQKAQTGRNRSGLTEGRGALGEAAAVGKGRGGGAATGGE